MWWHGLASFVPDQLATAQSEISYSEIESRVRSCLRSCRLYKNAHYECIFRWFVVERFAPHSSWHHIHPVWSTWSRYYVWMENQIDWRAYLNIVLVLAKVLICSRTTSIPLSSDAFSWEICQPFNTSMIIPYLQDTVSEIWSVYLPCACQYHACLSSTGGTIKQKMWQSICIDESVN